MFYARVKPVRSKSSASAILSHVCACGCLVVIAFVAGLVDCVLHGLWIVAALVVATAVAAGWFGRKMFAGRPLRRE